MAKHYTESLLKYLLGLRTECPKYIENLGLLIKSKQKITIDH